MTVAAQGFDRLSPNGHFCSIGFNGLSEYCPDRRTQIEFQMSFWVYMLRCSDGSYYAGHTDDLEHRVAAHESRHIPGCYTATRLPLHLVFSQEFATREEALQSERQIKGWSRAKKEALIRGDWPEISRLAKGRASAVPGTSTN